jgi:microcystin degradation protein MlrC
MENKQIGEEMRFAFGGIHIECSTYSRIRSRTEDFTVLTGEELSSAPDFAFLGAYPHRFFPTLYARAVPGGPVERETYEAFKGEFLQSLKELLPLDGLYLPMHGALYVDGFEDAEGDWISAARKVVGTQCLISASYDLHGNLSRRVIDNIDMLSAYRTAPHIDVQETMQRACEMLLYCTAKQIRPTLVWAPVPVLLPGERTSTEDQPAKELYARLEPMNARPGVLDVSLLVGYVWADEPRATASVVLTGTDRSTLEQQAVQLAQQYWDAREDFRFGVPVGSIAELLDQTEMIATQPVILADSGDNPTGGGVGDRAEVLEALLSRNFTNALVAGIADLPATELCYQQSPGSRLKLRIGASLDPQGSRPVEVEAEVLFLLPTGQLRERQAVVRIKGVTVVLTATRRPFHNIRDFTCLQLHIPSFKLLVVKSGYLSPELAPLANPNLMALSDGSILQDLDKLPKNQFRPQTYPFDRSFAWQPSTIVSARSPQETL